MNVKWWHIAVLVILWFLWNKYVAQHGKLPGTENSTEPGVMREKAKQKLREQQQ